MNCRDLTLQYTYTGGRVVTCTHRVWDANLFLTKRVEEGRNTKKPEDRFEVKIVELKK